MEKVTFEKRDIIGKKSKKLFDEGYIPAVFYNSKGDSTNIKITKSVASKIISEVTSATVLDAEYNGRDMKVIVKEADINPFTERIRHIAFFEIDEKQEITFTIPFKIIGVAPAVKNNLGILVEVLPSIDVRGKLSDLVPFIEIDVTKLEHPGQSISLDELELPKSLKLVNEDLAKATVVTITELQEEVVVEEPKAEEEVEGEEGKGKEVEGEEEETKEEAEATEK